MIGAIHKFKLPLLSTSWTPNVFYQSDLVQQAPHGYDLLVLQWLSDDQKDFLVCKQHLCSMFLPYQQHQMLSVFVLARLSFGLSGLMNPQLCLVHQTGWMPYSLSVLRHQTMMEEGFEQFSFDFDSYFFHSFHLNGHVVLRSLIHFHQGRL